MFISVDPRATSACRSVASAAVMIGIMVMPMPRPFTNSAPEQQRDRRGRGDLGEHAHPDQDQQRGRRCTNLPGPILSVSRPAIGMVSIAPMPCGASSSPAASVLSPRTWMK